MLKESNRMIQETQRDRKRSKLMRIFGCKKSKVFKGSYMKGKRALPISPKKLKKKFEKGLDKTTIEWYNTYER